MPECPPSTRHARPSDLSGIRRVLVVDDAPDFVALARAILSDAVPAADIVTAGTLRDGVAVHATGGPIDVVLLDLHLPDSRPEDTVVAWRTAVPDVPVVVLTVEDAVTVAAMSFRHGALVYLTKDDFNVTSIREAFALVAAR